MEPLGLDLKGAVLLSLRLEIQAKILMGLGGRT